MQVKFKDIIESDEFKNASHVLPVALGETETGEPFIGDLAEMAHILIGGATGQGKSVCLHNIILSLLISRNPEEVKFMLIDTTSVEFKVYSALGNKYLLKPNDIDDNIHTGLASTLSTLSFLNSELARRKELMISAQAHNFEKYNSSCTDKESRLPYIVVIIDEYSNLSIELKDLFYKLILPILTAGHVCGIHVVMTTQLLFPDVIPGALKANMPTRIAFRTVTGLYSITLLDCRGAEALKSQGEMIVSTQTERVKLFGALATESERKQIVDGIEKVCE